jgi:spore germination protein GerM
MLMKNHRRLFVRTLLLVSLIGVGLWLRSLQSAKMTDGEQTWLPWSRTTMVTLYFNDGRFLFPVSRRMPTNSELPHAALQALLNGPSAGDLKNPIPHDVQLRSFFIEDGLAHVNLSVAPGDTAATAIIETLTALRGITSVELSVGDQRLDTPAKRTPLVYFASPKGLVAIPVKAVKPRDALEMYLSGPPSPELTGLPPDVRLLAYDYNSADRLLSLKFSYTSSVRALAIDRPDRMRTVLLGLVASLTEFPEVRAVKLDFGGQTRLGLGQCSDLLRTPQPRPALLNDERLL